MRVNETLNFLETQTELPKEIYINNIYDFATKQFNDILETESYFIINKYQTELLFSTSLQLLELTKFYAKKLIGITISFDYELNPRNLRSERELKLNILCNPSVKGIPKSMSLINIKREELDTHMDYLCLNSPLLKTMFQPSVRGNRLHTNIESLYMLASGENEYTFPILETIMQRKVPCSFIYYCFDNY